MSIVRIRPENLFIEILGPPQVTTLLCPVTRFQLTHNLVRHACHSLCVKKESLARGEAFDKWGENHPSFCTGDYQKLYASRTPQVRGLLKSATARP
jgi:hypothetical protein